MIVEKFVQVILEQAKETINDEVYHSYNFHERLIIGAAHLLVRTFGRRDYILKVSQNALESMNFHATSLVIECLTDFEKSAKLIKFVAEQGWDVNNVAGLNEKEEV